ncbi:MAG: hypothetical protein J1F23_07220 [Oscillospiraceae bacterium]|nr:hypothetical protein [Oscillospiraceae bacterium]
MADLQDILSSISAEDMAKIKSVADSIMGGEEKQTSKPAPTGDLALDDNMLSRVMSVMGQMNKDDSRTRLIKDLKPLLSEERRQKADDALKFLQLMEMLPLLRGMFGQ